MLVLESAPVPVPATPRTPVVEILVPCLTHQMGTLRGHVRDHLTGRRVPVEARGLALCGSVLCFRLGAVEVDGEVYVVEDRHGRTAHVEPAEGSPLTVLL